MPRRRPRRNGTVGKDRQDAAPARGKRHREPPERKPEWPRRLAGKPRLRDQVVMGIAQAAAPLPKGSI